MANWIVLDETICLPDNFECDECRVACAPGSCRVLASPTYGDRCYRRIWLRFTSRRETPPHLSLRDILSQRERNLFAASDIESTLIHRHCESLKGTKQSRLQCSCLDYLGTPQLAVGWLKYRVLLVFMDPTPRGGVPKGQFSENEPSFSAAG